MVSSPRPARAFLVVFVILCLLQRLASLFSGPKSVFRSHRSDSEISTGIQPNNYSVITLQLLVKSEFAAFGVAHIHKTRLSSASCAKMWSRSRIRSIVRDAAAQFLLFPFRDFQWLIGKSAA